MNMIERVARAITTSIYDTTVGCVSPIKSAAEREKHIDREWQNYIPEARAAIEAMREPTEMMKNVWWPNTDVTHWQAMIDAALKEK